MISAGGFGPQDFGGKPPPEGGTPPAEYTGFLDQRGKTWENPFQQIHRGPQPFKGIKKNTVHLKTSSQAFIKHGEILCRISQKGKP
ncbi:MAG: hypothetical protein CM15mP28_0200 [Pseudomonadota bacterium]|nr:MAG: hypothetical protein CM15mP28_0200 [Pseudomonadota bacterium]